MVELSLMASSTCLPALFHQEQGPSRPSKEVLSIATVAGRKQEMMKSSLLHLSSPLVEDPLKPIDWLFNDQRAKLDSTTGKPMLIDVQEDTRANSALLSFGITENCIRREKIMQYLMSGSSEEEKDELAYSLLSSLSGIQTPEIEMIRSLFTRDDGVCLYDVQGDKSLASVIYPTSSHPQKPLLDPVADLSPLSRIVVHSDGRFMLNGTDVEMKDLVSVFEEFYLLNNSAKWKKQSLLVPHFRRMDSNEYYMDIHGSTFRAETITVPPLKSPETIKLKPSPKKRSSRKAGKNKDVYRRSSFHACESLLSLILDKNRGKEAILSIKKSGPELPQLLTQFSAGIAGTGLAVLFSVACNFSSGRAAFYASTLLNAGFGSALVWLSWTVNKLRDSIVHITKSSCKAGFNEKEMMTKVDRSVNEIFFRAATVMAIAVLRFV